MKPDLLIRGGICMTHDGPTKADLAIHEGRIVALGELSDVDAHEVIDATDLHVLPGVIDTQVHFREPGLEHKEDLGTGTAGAALGGVTAIFEMPNTKPSTLTAEALADKVRRGREKGWVDFAFFMGAAAENADKLAELETVPGCSGVKIFMGSSTGSLLVDDPEVLESVLQHGRRRIAVHCEDEERLVERSDMLRTPGITPHAHPEWRDEQTAYLATKKLLETAERTGRPVHVLHVTTEEEMELLGRSRHLCTVEVTPQHLTLAAPDCYDRLGTYAQMNPPIRGERHREALWRAVEAGIVDVIGSDHAPHTREEKERPYPQSPSGMPGVQTLVPIMLNHVNAGRLTLEQFVHLTAFGPARIYNIAGKGVLAPGWDGDVTIVDMNEKRTITNEWIASRSGWSPYDGMEVQGWPKYTIVRGNIVMRDDTLQGQPSGEPVRFLDTEPLTDA